MSDAAQLWAAAGTVVAALAGAVAAQWRAYRADQAERLAEARRTAEVLALATRAIDASNATTERLVNLLEDIDPRATPSQRKTYEPR